jgi:hypothetical protein
MKAKKKKDKKVPKNISPRSLPASEPMKPENPQTRAKLPKEKVRDLVQFPEYFDEETQGGRMPNPESDDDTLEEVQQWGFYLDADQEHPKQIDEQKQLDKAEKSRRKKKDQ